MLPLKPVQVEPSRLFLQSSVGEGILVGRVQDVGPDAVARHSNGHVYVNIQGRREVLVRCELEVV